MDTGRRGGFWATTTLMDPTAMANMATANMGTAAMGATDPMAVTMTRISGLGGITGIEGEIGSVFKELLSS